MAEKKITVAELKAEAERLLAAGEMPSAEEVAAAMRKVREEFAPKIAAAREKHGVQEFTDLEEDK